MGGNIKKSINFLLEGYLILLEGLGKIFWESDIKFRFGSDDIYFREEDFRFRKWSKGDSWVERLEENYLRGSNISELRERRRD